MKKKINCFRQSNNGVTLIELIVTILIMTIVTGCITLFISSSRNSYFRISNETALQTEADVAMTFLTDMAEEASAFRISQEHIAGAGGTLRQFNVLCMQIYDSEPFFCFIIHDEEVNELRFLKVKQNDTGKLLWTEGTSGVNINNIDIKGTLSANGIDNPDNKRCFLASYVTGFNPVVPAEKKGLLQVSIELKYGGSTYSANKNISSRNIG